MSKSFLFLVEGAKTEPSLLQKVLTRYGYNVVQAPRQQKTGEIDFDVSKLADDKSNVIIAQVSKNRLFELYIDYTENESAYDFNKLFNRCFSGIFLIFDVDHCWVETLEKLSDTFNNESDGLLLVSSPSIEVLSEPERTEVLEIKESFDEYKAGRNKHISKSSGCSAIDYICKNFERLIIQFIEKNRNDFMENNVSEHPMLVIKKINDQNSRKTDKSAIIRYFTTVIYVSIAYMKGLTREIDNYETVKRFFEERISPCK